MPYKNTPSLNQEKHSDKQSIQQNLEFGPEEIVLIIHADDFGMCHSVNQATEEAFNRGIISSGSIMVPCPWFPEAAAYYRKNPDVDLGIHLTLTSEWELYRWPPVAQKDKVPGLVDREGFLWHRREEVAQHATPKEVEMEIRAQIERALQFGIKPTHLDDHMGTLSARPEYLKVFYMVAEEFNVPPLIARRSCKVARPQQKQKRVEIIEKAESVVDRKLQGKFPVLDCLLMGSGVNYEERRVVYNEMLRNLKPGINQVILHLGSDDPEIEAVLGEHINTRRYDFLVFSEPETKEILRQRGIKLVGWRDLASRLHRC